ncbi:MAG: 50S ribosomal protein L28 [Deltaproteobacteria bacterium]|nr:50S ribosomal protein L28 [Deltaproteobacteria bacterium]
MAHRCDISKVSKQHGHRVSHAKNRRKHAFKGNIQIKKLFVPEENRSVTLKLSTRMIRTIDKIGLTATLKKFNLSLSDVAI